MKRTKPDAKHRYRIVLMLLADIRHNVRKSSLNSCLFVAKSLSDKMRFTDLKIDEKGFRENSIFGSANMYIVTLFSILISLFAMLIAYKAYTAAKQEQGFETQSTNSNDSTKTPKIVYKGE